MVKYGETFYRRRVAAVKHLSVLHYSLLYIFSFFVITEPIPTIYRKVTDVA